MKLHILSGGAAQGLVKALAGEFRNASGFDIDGTFGAVGAIRERLLAGAPADVVILSDVMIADLADAGHLAAGSRRDLGAVPTGIAVRAGDPVPDISNAAALRDVLRSADAIYLPDPTKATAGIHFAKVLHQLGAAADLTPRLKPFPHGQAAMAALAKHDSGAKHGGGTKHEGGTNHEGGRPIGCTQATEILATPGVAYAGPLPHEFELSTIYTAAVSGRSANPDAAQHFVEMLAAPASAALRAELGFTTLS